MKSAISNAQLKRLEKHLAQAASLGHGLATLGREILRDVRAATDVIAAYRQLELPLPPDGLPHRGKFVREKVRQIQKDAAVAVATAKKARPRSARSGTGKK